VRWWLLGRRVGAVVVAIAVGAAQARAATATFRTSGQSSFTVPAGVSSVSVTVIGAAGGGVGTLTPGFCGSGGDGAMVSGSFSVAPGEQLAVDVGAPGGNCGSGPSPGAGGNGGGASGGSGASGCDNCGGAGGGGASSVSSQSSPSAVLIVAGGGGGGGGGSGGSGGAAGAAGTGSPMTGGGGAGTAMQGGAGGAALSPGGVGSGTAGSFGQGGAGGAALAGGGGGGGGYYGGGGGAGGGPAAGGGGGSSFVAVDATAVTGVTTSSAAAEVVIAYPDPTSTAISCARNPMGLNAAASCTATVTDTASSPSNPTGTVSFGSSGGAGSFSGSTCTLSSVSGSGSASSCTVTFTPSSTTSSAITGSYNGDATHATSTGTFEESVSVPITGPRSTRTSVRSSNRSSTTGQAVTFTATVSPAPGSGTVAFTDDGTMISGCGTVAVSAAGRATCSRSYARAGDHTITTTFSGNGSYAPSSATLTQVVAGATPKGGPVRLGAHRVHGSSVSVTLRCPAGSGPACTIAATLTATETETISGHAVTSVNGVPAAKVAAQKKTVLLATVRVTIARGHNKTITISLNHTGKRLLGTFKKLKAKLTIKQSDRTRATTTITFKP